MIERKITGRYILRDELGSGSMGTVYRGLDTVTEQIVAIKQLKAHLAQPEMIERFTREGEALRDLNHPNIVKMLDAVEEDGHHYLIMEYIAGGDLTSLLSRGLMPSEMVVRLAIDLADALTRAHKLNIIHRDLKPANVLIGNDNVLRLTDFGVAHIGSKVRVTETDTIVGTIDYLPTEAFSGGTMDARGDIWAFGVMLFEMLSGERPFKGQTILEVIHSITTQPIPDLESLAPHAPIALVDLVFRMLERDPSARISSVRYVGATLEDILRGRDNPNHIPQFDPPVSDLLIRPKHNLPSQTTPFVGREHEKEALAKLISDPLQRLITILAPGGMGKTRLAIETAGQHVASFKNGVYFVDLTTLSDPLTIVLAIAEAVNLTFTDEDKLSPKQQMLQFLASKHLLLVMDNWEHLIEGAGLVSEILKSALEVQILATSRHRLEQAGETLFHLSGMEFPQWETPEDALEYAAVKLYMNSARRVQPAFAITVDNLDHIARTCRLVAGMPLGIVLAASWLAALSPAEIAAEIEAGIDFLEATGGEIPERQRSIRVVFDYTWQELSADEQLVFKQMSVFTGGFTRQAAQTVTGVSLRHLMSFINASLLRRDVESGRYTIHELLRQYALEHLQVDPDVHQTVQAKHSHYYLQHAASYTQALKGGRQKQAFDEMGDDFENIRQAWLYAAAQGWIDLLAQSLEALQIFSSFTKTSKNMQSLWEAALQACERQDEPPMLGFYIRARYADAEAEIHELLKIADAKQDATLLRHCYGRLRIMSHEKRDYEQSLYYAEKELETATRQNDPYYLSRAHYNVGFASNDSAAQLDHYITCYNMFKERGDSLGLIFPLGALATRAAVFEGNFLQKYNYDKESVAILLQFRQIKNSVFNLSNLAIASFLLGMIDEGEKWLEAAAAASQMFNDAQSIASVEAASGLLHCIKKHYPMAQVVAEACIKRTSNRALVGYAWVSLAIAATALNDDSLAEKINRGIHFAPLKNPEQLPFVTIYLPSIAHVMKQQGQHAYAVEICSIALHHPQSPVKFFQCLPLLQELIIELKHMLPPDEYGAAWEQGKTTGFSSVVDRFLQEHPI